MSVRVTVKSVKEIRCPHCGEIAGYETLKTYQTGGYEWEDYLTKIGYSPWGAQCAGDKPLTEDEARAMVEVARGIDTATYKALKSFVAYALYDGIKIVINVRW